MEPGDVLVACNCLFREACEESPQVICDLHVGMLAGLIEAAGQRRRVELLGGRPGQGCAFVVEEDDPR